MSYGRLLLTGCLCVVLAGLLLVGGCRKAEEDEGKVEISNNEPLTPPKQTEGFIEEKPLTDSPFELGGMSLGQGLSELQEYMGAAGEDCEVIMDELTQTGSLVGSPDAEAAPGEPRQELAYFKMGVLVGFQQLIDMDRAAFDARTAELTALYGAPVTALPEYLQLSDLYVETLEAQPAELAVWADKATRTVLLGSLSQDERQAMWVVFHPEDQGDARFDAVTAVGS